jgi:hypothetical protein
MNAQVETSEDTSNITELKPKEKVPPELVKMTDGREVEFAGKKKLIKDVVFNSDGSLSHIQFDFRNGETLKFAPTDSTPNALALGHGYSQKIGDETAGLTEVDDMVLAVQEIIERLEKGEWTVTREGGGMQGTSILLKALAEYGGRTIDQVKEFLKGKTQADKIALRNNDKRRNAAGFTLKEIVQRLEAEKALKTSKIDTDAMLEGF